MTPRRASENPILTPAMVRPTRADFDVVGVFNPGVIRHDGDVILLVRVAEAPRQAGADEVAAAVLDPRTGGIVIRRWPRTTPGLDASDPRLVRVDGRCWLTSISHLRIARSRDGTHFDLEAGAAMAPADEYEAFGIEDPRITRIDDTYWVNYTAVSPNGIATALASTTDFRTFERHGVIFPPDNRDVTVFPERIGGRFVALHRPMPTEIGAPAIWIASSPDRLAWGSHRVIATARAGHWDDAKVGGGAVPFRVRARGYDGWLAIYHGVTASPYTYSLGALLLDAGDPARVIARSKAPILQPEAPYEREGFFGGVVFTCGVLPDGDQVRIYYGAADGVTAVADLSLPEILAGLSDP